MFAFKIDKGTFKKGCVQMRIFGAVFVLLLVFTAVPAFADSLLSFVTVSEDTDARPEVEQEEHNLGNLWSAFANNGTFGDAQGNMSSMEWPGGSGSDYLWSGDLWSCCYGEITGSWPDSAAKWASCSDYGSWELWPSEGYPMQKLVPGPVADEQTQYGYDDWYLNQNENPYGIGVWEENYSWTSAGYDNFIVNRLVITHHSEFGSGAPLDGFVAGIRGDCDVAAADSTEAGLDDLVYYDGHAIWANGNNSFEYIFDGGVTASTQDVYIYQQNPDNPLSPSDPQNIYYYYNYPGSDGIPDNDVDQNGVSDHFTILAKVAGGDTTYITDPASGIELFSAGMPYFHYTQTVADTTYLVVPRNLSYMWDSDNLASTEDDSGEPDLGTPCNGFIGWRLLDFYIVKADQTIQRPADVWGVPIPLSHTWWNWEDDPGTDVNKYNYMWGNNPDSSGLASGPLYLSNWVGNPNTPEAITVANPGPFPIVQDSPVNLGAPVFDYRFLVSMAPVELEEGDSLFITGGWVVGLGLDGLRRNADLMLDAYYRDTVWGQGLGIQNDVADADVSLNISPNPCPGNMLSVSFSLDEPCSASLSVFDLSGRLIQNTYLGDLGSGINSAGIDGSSLSNGMYFAVLETGHGVSRGRFVILR